MGRRHESKAGSHDFLANLAPREGTRALACSSLHPVLNPMTVRKLTPGKLPQLARARAAATSWQGSVGSWTSLLAATTLGVAGASTVHAEVHAADAELSEGRPYRLVVQSYDGSADGVRLSSRARPVASMQRAITPDELRRGVKVDLLELRQLPASGLSPAADADPGNLAKALVLAWVEEGKPDLEYDARRARPLPGSFVGAAPRTGTQESVRISIRAGVSG
jgi:hypothetical protein